MNGTVGHAVCLVLHICRRPQWVETYNRTFALWGAERPRSFDMFYIDSCGDGFDFPNIKRINYRQEPPPRKSWNLTPFERAQSAAVLENLPPHCTFVIKLTGKYHAPALVHHLDALDATRTRLLIQRRAAWGGTGWPSELFGADRELLRSCLGRWARESNTEAFVKWMRSMVRALNVSFVKTLPRMKLSFQVKRSSDGRLMTAL